MSNIKPEELAAPPPGPRFLVTRWFASHAALAVPQAAAPIAFGLLALPLTGNPDDGAAMILAMMGAQLIGAVPLARLATGRNNLGYLKLLILLRSLALAGILVLAAVGIPFGWLIAAAALAGVVNGAAAGILRAMLNSFISVGKLPRALGVAATVNELVFVSAPVLASLVGAISPLIAVATMAVLGAAPILLLPNRLAASGTKDSDDDDPVSTSPAPTTGSDKRTQTGSHPVVSSDTNRSSPSSRPRSRLLTPPLLLWLLCATASSTSVAAIEVSAVTLALSYGLEATWSFLFPVALCLGSVSGGIYVTVRNRMPRRRTVLGYLLGSMFSSAVVAAAFSIETTVAAALVLGFLLPPLGTYYQLVLDTLAPEDRRAEVFAQLRNATSLGVILVSLSLTLWNIQTTLIAATALLCMAAAAVVGSRLMELRRTGRTRRPAPSNRWVPSVLEEPEPGEDTHESEGR